VNQQLATIVFGHANGFPAPVYRKLREALNATQWLEADCLGQGSQGIGRNWTGITRQMLECARQAPRPRIGLGHSLGGFALYLAEHAEPGLLDGMILLEPPMFRPATRNLIRLVRSLGLLNRFPPVSLALRRKRHWPDRDAARDYFASKALFAPLDPDCLDDYLREGLVPEAAGLGLKYRAETEYRVFYEGPPAVPRLRQTPSLAAFVYGQQTQVLKPADLHWLRKRLSGFTHDALPGGHLFPLEHPQQTADSIVSRIESAGFRLR
jgi:pimeloyl-ACP methyl ester carboxylesterase